MLDTGTHDSKALIEQTLVMIKNTVWGLRVGKDAVIAIVVVPIPQEILSWAEKGFEGCFEDVTIVQFWQMWTRLEEYPTKAIRHNLKLPSMPFDFVEIEQLTKPGVLRAGDSDRERIWSEKQTKPTNETFDSGWPAGSMIIG